MGNGLDPSVYVTRPYAPAETRLRAFIAYLQAVPRAAAADPRQSAHAAAAQLHRLRQGRRSAASPNIIRGDGKAAFAEVARSGAAGASSTRASRDAAAGDAGPRRLARSAAAATRPRISRSAPSASRRCSATPRWSTCRSPSSRRSAAPTSQRNQDALRAACAPLRAGRDACRPAWTGWARNKPQGGAGRRRARAARRAQAPSSWRRTSSRIPGTEEAQVEEAPPYNRQNFAYIDIPGPVRDAACRRSITSRRPIRPGRRRCRPASSRARRTCCSPRCTRSGPATSSTSSTPTARRFTVRPGLRRLRLSPRAGRITPRR